MGKKKKKKKDKKDKTHQQASQSSSNADKTVQVGSRLSVRDEEGVWESGVCIELHDDGTCKVQYDPHDGMAVGDMEDGVPLTDVRLDSNDAAPIKTSVSTTDTLNTDTLIISDSASDQKTKKEKKKKKKKDKKDKTHQKASQSSSNADKTVQVGSRLSV